MPSNTFCCSSVDIPVSLHTPLMSFGGGISTIALIFAFRPPGVSIFPIYGTSLSPNLILSLFGLIDISTHFCSSALRFLSWSCIAASSVSPFSTRSMSSAMIWMLFKPCNASFRADWNNSLHTFNPNGGHRKCMFQNGVLFVIR